MVDESTHHFTSFFVCSQSTQNIWIEIQHICCLLYFGASDYLLHHQIFPYPSKKKKKWADSLNKQLEQARIETARALKTVKTYHASLRLAYEHDRADMDRQNGDH